MRRGSDSSPRQLLAVAFAVMMLLSMGGVAFVGGAGAQTGGTADNVFSVNEDVSDELNISSDSGSVSLVGPTEAGGGGVDDVSVAEDGTVEIGTDATSDAEEFAGVEISPDRVQAVTDTTADPANQADFLDDIPNEFQVESSGDDAFPAIFIEYAPQSNISQIEGSNGLTDVAANTNGEHDFIVIANSDNLTNITTSTGTDDVNANGDVVALSVDNDDLDSGSVDVNTASEATVLADGSDFGTVASELTGSSTTNLQNENIDQIQFTAGTFEATSSSGDTIQQVLLADDIDSTDFDAGANDGGGETIHSEKITLSEDGADDTFFASIDGADAAADANNNAVITVDRGEYSALENSGSTVLSLETAGLTVETNDRTPAGTTDTADRFTVDAGTDTVALADADNESVVSREIDITGADVTVSGLVVDDEESLASTDAGSNSNTDASVTINENNTALDNVIVAADGAGAGAVDVASGSASAITITDSAILEANPVSFENGDVGLALDGIASATVSNSSFVGFEAQINGLANVNTADIVADNRDAFFDDDRTQLAVVENASGAVQDVDTLFGAITDADGDASTGDVIAVAPGIYDDTASVDIDTDDVVLDGTQGSERPEILDGVILDESSNATVDGFVVNAAAGITNADNTGDSVTIQNVTLPAEDSAIDVGAGNSVTIDTVEFTNTIDTSGLTNNAVVNIDGDEPDVTVTDVTIEDLDLSSADLTGVNIPTAGSAVSVTNTTVDVDDDTSGSPTGIVVGGIDTASSGNGGLAATVNIDNNTLLDLSNGAGLDLDEGTGGSAGSLDINGNEIRGGTSLVGIDYTLADTVGTNVTANTIIGADVDGEANSVGVRFEAVTVSGDGVISSGDATTLTFEDNVLSGHARIVESQDDEFVASDYDAIVGQALVDGEDLNNTIGTLVVGPDGTDPSGSSYQETYGSITDTGNAVSYLPGSVEQAAALVNNADSPGSDDTADVDVSALEVQDPAINGVTSPDSYDEGGDAVDFPDMESLTITGAGDAQAPLVEDSQILIENADAINNHTVADLAITSSASAALDVTSGVNSQTTFANLDVTADNVGLDVGADGSDVNVIEVRDSTFDVGTDGIVLASSPGDDRDGFVLDNVTLAGPGIDTADSTGLDLSNVDKPGKEELPVELEVRELNVRDFETQLQLSDSLVNNFDALDAEAVVTNNVGSLNAGDANVVFEDNEFLQAALVSAEVTLTDDSTEERLADATTIYGSIDEADTEGVDAVDASPADLTSATDIDTIDTAIIDVRTGPAGAFSDDRTFSTDEVVYEETVSLGAIDSSAADLLVRGPQAGVDAGASFRDGGEAVILGASNLGGTNAGSYTDITVDGFTIVGDSGGDAVAVNAAPTTVSLDNTAVSAFDADNRANGVDITVDTDVTLAGSFVGNHDAVAAVNNGVIVESTEASLTVEADSLLNGGSATGVDVVTSTASVDVDGDVANFATGVDVTDAATVTVTSNITGHDNDGVSVTSGADLTATGASISDNGAAGLFVDSDSATVDVDQSTVMNNANDAGIQLTAVADTATHNITRTAFSGNDVGVDAATSTAATENVTVRGNAFTGTEAVTSTEPVDATLNFFGDRKGPESAGGASVSETVVYDPFLTGDETDRPVADIETTTGFAHDVVVPEDQLVSVGFPADPGDGTTIEDVFDVDDIGGNVYALDRSGSDPTFRTVDPSDEVEAFDAFVVEANGDARVVAIEYTNDRSFSDPVANTFEYQEGINFVPAQAAGTVDETLFTGEDSDSVQLPFATGENLYGTDAPQVRDEFTDPSADGFFGTFRTGVGDEVVHPHVGYIVTVNDGDSAGNQRAETIPAPDAPTAANIDERTDTTAGVVTNVQTGDTYDSLAVALDEVQDGQTLELGVGTFEDGFEQTVTTDDVTLRGAGDEFTTVEDDLTVTGDDVRLRGIDVVGTVTLDGQGSTVNQLSVTANSPGDLVINADNVAVSNADIDGALDTSGTEGGDTVRVSDSTFTSQSTGGGTVEFSFAGSENVQVLTGGDDLSSGDVEFSSNDRIVLMPGDYTGNSADIANADTTLTSAPQADASDVVISGTDTNGDVLKASADGVAIEDVTIESPGSETGVTLSDAGATLDGVVFDSQADDTTYVDDTMGNVDLDAVIADNTFDQEPAVDGDTVVVRSTLDVYNVDQQTSSETIQAAVDSADDGDTIEVAEGDYDQVIIDREDDAANLTIEAVGARDATTISHSVSDGEPTVAVDQDGITLDGFAIERTSSSDLTAQAVRVAGSDVTLADNTYEVDGNDDAAVAVLTASSGAAGNPDVSGETFDNIEITGGEAITSAGESNQASAGLLVADNGDADFGDNPVAVSGVQFTSNDDAPFVVEFDTTVLDLETIQGNNEFDPDEEIGNVSINGQDRDAILVAN